MELKDRINKLDEVFITSNFGNKEFNLEEFNYRFNLQIKNDLRRNPHKYRRKRTSNYGINLGEFFFLAKKSLKKH